METVKSQKSDESIIIIPADKGNKTVILNKEDYLEKLYNRNSNQIKIEQSPAEEHEKKLNAALTEIQNSPTKTHNTKDNLILDRKHLSRFKTDSKVTPSLSGRLKAHKENYPLREISDAVGAPGHELSKMLNRVFSPYVGNTKTHLKNGEHFINILRSGRL